MCLDSYLSNSEMTGRFSVRKLYLLRRRRKFLGKICAKRVEMIRLIVIRYRVLLQTNPAFVELLEGLTDSYKFVYLNTET